MLSIRMRTVNVKKTGRRLLTVAADADPMDVRSRRVCTACKQKLRLDLRYAYRKPAA